MSARRRVSAAMNKINKYTPVVRGTYETQCYILTIHACYRVRLSDPQS